MAKGKASSVIKTTVTKYWPWMLGGGVLVGLYLMLSSDGDDSGGGDSSNADQAYYNAQLQMAQLSQAAAAQNGQIQAQLQIAAAQASALQDAAQAEVISAQAQMAQAVGTTFAGIMQVSMQPQLMAMKEASNTTQAALEAAAAGQIATQATVAQQTQAMLGILPGLGYGTAQTIQGGQAVTLGGMQSIVSGITGAVGAIF